MLRLLLWPHPLVPEAGFIGAAHDAALVAEAEARMARFGFAGVAEEPGLEGKILAWIAGAYGISFWSRLERALHGKDGARSNRAEGGRFGVPRPMAEELAGGTQALLRERTRLDRALWRGVAARRMAGADLDGLEREGFARNCGRYDRLMGFGEVGEGEQARPAPGWP